MTDDATREQIERAVESALQAGNLYGVCGGALVTLPQDGLLSVMARTYDAAPFAMSVTACVWGPQRPNGGMRPVATARLDGVETTVSLSDATDIVEFLLAAISDRATAQ